MAYKYRKTRKTYAKRPVRRVKRKRAAPRQQTLVIKIVGANGPAASTAVLGKKSGRPVYARF